MSDSQVPFAHPKCYAASRNNCSPKLSREHVITHGVLRASSTDGKVRVGGWPYLPAGTTADLPTNNVVAKVLCEKHNQALSALDEAAVRLFRCIREVERRVTTNNRVTLRIDGHTVERWMLKSLCGIARLDGSIPPEWWLDILFGDSPFPPTLGLYFSPEGPPHVPRPGNGIGFDLTLLREDPIGVYGALLSLSSIRFVVAMAQPPAVRTGTQLEHASYHPPALVLRNRDTERTIEFVWQTSENGPPAVITYDPSA